VWASVCFLAALAFLYGLFIAGQILDGAIAASLFFITALLGEISSSLRDIAAATGGE
jgi:hypothetical protein